MAKLTLFNDIRNQIQLEGFYCGLSGLQIDYTYQGNQHTIMANPEQAADLLKHAGLIEDYTGAADDVAVECWIDSVLTQLHWKRFIYNWEGLCELDALNLATVTEDHKQMERWAQELRSIPALVSEIANPNREAAV